MDRLRRARGLGRRGLDLRGGDFLASAKKDDRSASPASSLFTLSTSLPVRTATLISLTPRWPLDADLPRKGDRRLAEPTLRLGPLGDRLLLGGDQLFLPPRSGDRRGGDLRLPLTRLDLLRLPARRPVPRGLRLDDRLRLAATGFPLLAGACFTVGDAERDEDCDGLKSRLGVRSPLGLRPPLGLRALLPGFAPFLPEEISFLGWSLPGAGLSFTRDDRLRDLLDPGLCSALVFFVSFLECAGFKTGLDLPPSFPFCAGFFFASGFGFFAGGTDPDEDKKESDKLSLETLLLDTESCGCFATLAGAFATFFSGFSAGFVDFGLDLELAFSFLSALLALLAFFFWRLPDRETLLCFAFLWLSFLCSEAPFLSLCLAVCAALVSASLSCASKAFSFAAFASLAPASARCFSAARASSALRFSSSALRLATSILWRSSASLAAFSAAACAAFCLAGPGRDDLEALLLRDREREPEAWSSMRITSGIAG
mmetsp:Transcript_2478/g.4923  ORF Transcript_2478/g.4923 Transcript_2478/m.4923 type:complete len:485 (+) Transcript_2478:163-1617(+)